MYQYPVTNEMRRPSADTVNQHTLRQKHQLMLNSSLVTISEDGEGRYQQRQFDEKPTKLLSEGMNAMVLSEGAAS